MTITTITCFLFPYKKKKKNTSSSRAARASIVNNKFIYSSPRALHEEEKRTNKSFDNH
jgi:hypothetical protein